MRSLRHSAPHVCLALSLLWLGLCDRGFAQSTWAQCHRGDIGGDTNSCAADRPCFKGLFQDGSSIHISWNGGQNYDLYHVIAGEPGQHVGQAELGGGASASYQINDVRACAKFVIKVQGCITHFLAARTVAPGPKPRSRPHPVVLPA